MHKFSNPFPGLPRTDHLVRPETLSMRLFTRPLLAFAVSILLPLTLTITSRAAYADTIDFSYTGSLPSPVISVAGSGSFSYSGSPSTLTLASLTAFTFTDTIIDGSQSSPFTYSLADLTSFAATLSGDTLLTLSLQTGFESGTNGFIPESFTVTNLGVGGASTDSTVVPSSAGQVTETGSSSDASPVPEPSTLALFGSGILGLAGAARRKFVSL